MYIYNAATSTVVQFQSNKQKCSSGHS